MRFRKHVLLAVLLFATLAAISAAGQTEAPAQVQPTGPVTIEV